MVSVKPCGIGLLGPQFSLLQPNVMPACSEEILWALMGFIPTYVCTGLKQIQDDTLLKKINKFDLGDLACMLHIMVCLIFFEVQSMAANQRKLTWEEASLNTANAQELSLCLKLSLTHIFSRVRFNYGRQQSIILSNTMWGVCLSRWQLFKYWSEYFLRFLGFLKGHLCLFFSTMFLADQPK